MKKSNTNILDRENISSDEAIRTSMKNEQIILSSKVYKFNEANKQQERVLVITNKAIYNVLPTNMVSSFMTILSNSARIKRKIGLDKVQGVTISRFGFEFLIHVPSEYDYRYSSVDFRDQILSAICLAFTQNNKVKKMPCYFKDDMILISYVTTKKDKQKNFNRMPTENPELLDPEAIKLAEGQKVQAEIIYSQSVSKSQISIDDFQVVKVLGRGSFGKVMLCEHKKTKQVYAIKSLNKEAIIQKDQIEHTKTEREMLTRVNHPFLVQLVCAFQTEQKLFFLMPFARGGELFHHLQQHKRFNEEWTKFYIGSLVLALEYLHELGYAYRDVKPENVLLNEDGYITLTDFGLAKKLKQEEYATSFVGTPDYMAPETIMNEEAYSKERDKTWCHNGHNYMIDWWGLGVLMYEMCIGITPFYHENQKKLFENIINKEVRFPNSIKLSDEYKDLVMKLLTKNPEKRLGRKKDGQEIRAHSWFADMNFEQLVEKKIKPPFLPQLSGDKYDVNNFDKEFTSENPYFSMVNQNDQLVQQFDNEFAGMSYQQEI